MRAAVLVLALLTGCATKPPQIVHVPVPCAAALPERPAVHADAEVGAMPEGRMVLALHADRLAWRGYAVELEAVARACAP